MRRQFDKNNFDRVYFKLKILQADLNIGNSELLSLLRMIASLGNSQLCSTNLLQYTEQVFKSGGFEIIFPIFFTIAFTKFLSK